MSLLQTIETYYDAAPRPSAAAHEVGPFTLFVRNDPTGWPYYARPRLGDMHRFTVDDVQALRARQRELEVPESIEWVHETTPSLLPAAQQSGLTVQECPLLVLAAGDEATIASKAPGSVSVLDPGSADLAVVVGAISAGFAGTDAHEPRDPARQIALMRAGLTSVAAAYDTDGHVVGGGSHSPRGTTTELTGIAVLPRARKQGFGAAITAALVRDALSRGVETVFLSAQDDAVARVYERVGFVRVGTACIAEPSDG